MGLGLPTVLEFSGQVDTFKCPCWQMLNMLVTADLNSNNYIQPETRQHPVVQTLSNDLLTKIQHLPTETFTGIDIHNILDFMVCILCPG
jgi:hypothetical protein